MVPVCKNMLRRLLGRGQLLGWLVIVSAIWVSAQSGAKPAPGANPAAAAELPVAGAAEAVLYDRYIKVQVPAEWQEKRSWELGEDRSLPLYNPATGAVAFVWGFGRPLYRHGYIESLASGDRLSRRLEMDLSLWPSEAARYYAMVSGGFMMRTSGHTVTLGPSLNPATVHYLGKIKAGRAELDLVEYISEGKVDQAFATKYRMASELEGSQAQILLGQATFGHSTHGYTLIACRFTTQPEDTSWIRPLLQGIGPVSTREREKAAMAERIRDVLSHTAAVLEDRRFSPALAGLQAVLQRDPQNDNALMLEGEAMLYQHRAQEAEKALRRAIAINANNERAHFLLGAALWKEKQYEAARAEWKLVQQISPLYPQIEEVLQKRQHAEAAKEKEP